MEPPCAEMAYLWIPAAGDTKQDERRTLAVMSFLWAPQKHLSRMLGLIQQGFSSVMFMFAPFLPNTSLHYGLQAAAHPTQPPCPYFVQSTPSSILPGQHEFLLSRVPREYIRCTAVLLTSFYSPASPCTTDLGLLDHRGVPIWQSWDILAWSHKASSHGSQNHRK